MSDKTSESPENDPEEPPAEEPPAKDPPAKATWISPEKWTAWLKFGLLAAFPFYLVLDYGIGHVFTTDRIEYREKLCFTFEDELDEAARQNGLPVTILGKFNHFLRCGAIDEISFLGGKISNDRIIRKKQERTEENAATLAVIADVQRRIETLETTPPSSGEVSALVSSLEDARVSLVQSVENGERGIARLEQSSPSLVPDSSRWLLVAGADKTPDQAAVQARVIARLVAEFSQATRAPDRQGTVMILDRNGAFRTVVQFGSRSAARAASAEMKSKLKYGGYVREQGGWCPDPTPIDPIEGFESFSCVNG